MRSFTSYFSRLLLPFVLCLIWSCAPPVSRPVTEAGTGQVVKKKPKPEKVTKKRKPAAVLPKQTASPAAPAAPGSESESAPSASPADDDAAEAKGELYYYDYYPDVEVYFDTVRHLYFYPDKGGWSMSVALPIAFQENLGRSVSLRMRESRPYRRHDEQLDRFPPKPKEPEF